MEYLANLTLGELIRYIVGIIGVISVIVEFNKKIPFNPWSAIIQWVGKQLFKSVTDRMRNDLIELKEQQEANNEAIIELNNKLDSRFTDVNNRFNQQRKEADEKEAKRLRASIISFSDSCRVGQHHTKNHFENVFRDVDDYNMYCDEHSIPNHYIEGEVAYIKKIYQECVEENKFL